MSTPLKVVIDAQVESGEHGGIEQVLIGLLHGLACLNDENQEYLVVGRRGESEWLIPYLGRNQRLVYAPGSSGSPFERVKGLLGPLRRPLGAAKRGLKRQIRGSLAPLPPQVSTSSGFYESLGAHVLHILYPLNFVRSEVATLLTIYDLQHRHLPQFFSQEHMAWRETVYPAAFAHARLISAISEWVKQDLVLQYQVPSQKVRVAPLAPTTPIYGPLEEAFVEEVRRKFRLKIPFVFYPALTYGHKNHLRLLEAVAWLRDRQGLKVHLVCSGQTKHFWAEISKRIQELDLTAQVQFVGFVKPEELRALFRLACGMIFPSLFEGAGIPVLEAFAEGLPVACSDIPALREYAADAAHFFDPTRVEAIADSLRRMMTDEPFREQLQQRGFIRAREFSWERTARMYSDLYQEIAFDADPDSVKAGEAKR